MSTSSTPTDPGRLELRDPKAMRMLAHPARLAILEQLYGGRTATATELAEICGLSPSATSYHLRELAKHNLIGEAPSRGDGRERVWQPKFQGFTVGTDLESTAEAHEAERALLDAVLVREQVRARSWLDRSRTEPTDWVQAANILDAQLVATAEELKQLNTALLDLLRPYQRANRPDPPPGSRRISAVFQAFPLE